MILKWLKIKTCQHPFEDSKKIGTVVDKDRINIKYTVTRNGLTCDRYTRFVHHVRQCGYCNKYFLDSGFEL